jgi:hypothetical protein
MLPESQPRKVAGCAMLGIQKSVSRLTGVNFLKGEFRLIKVGETAKVEPKVFRVLLFLLHSSRKLCILTNPFKPGRVGRKNRARLASTKAQHDSHGGKNYEEDCPENSGTGSCVCFRV